MKITQPTRIGAEAKVRSALLELQSWGESTPDVW